MARIRTLLVGGVAVGSIGILLWTGLDAVMRGVSEMEQRQYGVRQVVTDDRTGKSHQPSGSA